MGLALKETITLQENSLKEGNRMGRKSLAVIPSLVIILLSISQFLGLSGCAHMPKPPSEEMRAQFGTIGIVSATSNPKIQFHPEFAKGRLSGAGIGFSAGLGVGVLYGAVSGAAASTPSGGFLIPFLAAGGAAIGGVIGGVYGGIAGAVNAVPKKEAQRIEATAKNAFDGIDIQKTMAASVSKNSLELPDYAFVLLGEEDLIISPPYDFSFLNERGIDTVLELNAKSGGFKEGKGKDPFIAFFIKVHTRLIRTSDGKEIYSKEFEYKSSKYRSAEWFDTDARLLREEIDICFKELPKQIVEELFEKNLFKFSSIPIRLTQTGGGL
jgi:hypothetical protein